MSDYWNIDVDMNSLWQGYHVNSQQHKELLTVQLTKEAYQSNLNQYSEHVISQLPEQKASDVVEALLDNRKTNRERSDKELSLSDVYRLLRFGVGDKRMSPSLNYPSPGKLYPTEIYFSLDIAGFEQDLYYYNPYYGTISRVLKDKADELKEAIIDPQLRQMPLILYLACDYRPLMDKYGYLSYRLLCQENGHIAQNLSLYSYHLGYNSVCIGGYYERDFKRHLPDKDLHYIIAIG